MRLLWTGENPVVPVMMVLTNNVTMEGCDDHKLIFLFLSANLYFVVGTDFR
jgi:hypothetical protein